jgi:hypothetical protein
MNAFLSCLVVVASLSNSGQLAAQASCPLSVPVIALASGPTGGISAKDLRATMKGKEITIKEINPPPATRRFVFVLDRSGSMVGKRTMPDSAMTLDLNGFMRQSVEQAVSEIPNGDSIAFLAFSGEKSTQLEFAGQKAALAELPAILAWWPGKGIHRTPLWLNIETALKMLTPHEAGDVIVVVSDGRDNESTISMEKLQADLLTAGVTVLAISIAIPLVPVPEEPPGPKEFAALAEATGGAIAVADPRLASAFPMNISLLQLDQLIPLLARQYELEMEAPAIQKPEKWELKANSAAAGKNLSLLYPHYLLPCTETH